MTIIGRSWSTPSVVPAGLPMPIRKTRARPSSGVSPIVRTPGCSVVVGRAVMLDPDFAEAAQRQRRDSRAGGLLQMLLSCFEEAWH